MVQGQYLGQAADKMRFFFSKLMKHCYFFAVSGNGFNGLECFIGRATRVKQCETVNQLSVVRMRNAEGRMRNAEG